MAKDLRWAVGRPRGDSPIHIHCPRHDDTEGSLAVYHDHGWCYGCPKDRAYFTPAEIVALAKVRADDLPEADTVTDRNAPPPPPSPALIRIWHENLVSPASPLTERVAWLYDRGITPETIRRQQLGHTGRYFTLPVWDMKTGQLLGIRQRRDDRYCDPDAPKYTQPARQPALLYRPNPWGRVKIITEGEFDALVLAQLGLDAMTSTAGAGSLATLFAGWRFHKPVWVATDQDPAGDDAYAALRRAVTGDLRRVRFGGAKDVSDALAGLRDWQAADVVAGWLT